MRRGVYLVDFVDLGILDANFGNMTGQGWSVGDFNGDLDIDQDDRDLLLANIIVPEPTTAIAMAGLMLVDTARRRRAM